MKLPAATALFLLAGCVTVGRVHEGEAIPPEAVQRIQVGTTTLTQLLADLGSPLEFHRHPDGLVLVYRWRGYHYLRLGLEPDRAIPLGVSELPASQVLRNIHFVTEWGTQGEDRLAILVDKDHVVAGVGLHRGAP